MINGEFKLLVVFHQGIPKDLEVNESPKYVYKKYKGATSILQEDEKIGSNKYRR